MESYKEIEYSITKPLWDYDKKIPFINLSRTFDLGTSWILNSWRDMGPWKCMSTLCAMLRVRNICFEFGSPPQQYTTYETNDNLFDLSRPLGFLTSNPLLWMGLMQNPMKTLNPQRMPCKYYSTSNQIHMVPKAFKV